MSNKTIAVAARTEPGDSVELRVFNPDTVVLGADNGIDWTKTPYTSVYLFPDGVLPGGTLVVKNG